MTPKKYTTVLFDFDGCIADTLPIWLRSFRKIYDDMGIDISDREIIDKSFHRWDEVKEIKIPDIDLFAKTLYTYFNTYSKDLALHEGIIESIHSLREQGIKTAVVTSTLRETIDEKLDHLNMSHLFDTVLAWEDTEKNKPDPEPILEAMKRLSADPDETIMIGDNEVDIISAHKAGATSIWYYPKVNEFYYPDNAFAHLKPDHTIGHFDELEDIALDFTSSLR